MGLFIERKERRQRRERWSHCHEIGLEGSNTCQWKCKLDIKVQPGPHAFMAWGSFSILYALPPPAKYVEEDSDCSVCSISGGRSSVVSVS